MTIVWPSTANAGTAASAAVPARMPIANPLENFIVISSPRRRSRGFLLFRVDHFHGAARLAGVAVALVLEPLMLEVGLVGSAGAVARQDVHDLGIAVGVDAAA